MVVDTYSDIRRCHYMFAFSKHTHTKFYNDQVPALSFLIGDFYRNLITATQAFIIENAHLHYTVLHAKFH